MAKAKVDKKQLAAQKKQLVLVKKQITAKLKAQPKETQKALRGIDWGAIFNNPLAQQILMQLLEKLFHPKPEPAPTPTPIPAPTPTPTPAPTPTPGPTPSHGFITGGHGKITGITQDGPTGPRVAGERLAQILAGTANAPHDSRFEIDITPSDGTSDYGPDDPRWAGQLMAPYDAARDTEPPSQPIRLDFDYSGAGSADLAHEYQNFGCTPRIRVKTPNDQGGTLTNLRARYAGADGKAAYITVHAGPIHVGRGA